MNVQTDVGQVVKVLAGNHPDDLANLPLGIMGGQTSKRVRFDFFIGCQFCHIIQQRAFYLRKQTAGPVLLQRSNLAWLIDALIVNDRPISMQNKQTLIRATCSRMSITVSGARDSFLSSLPTFP